MTQVQTCSPELHKMSEEACIAIASSFSLAPIQPVQSAVVAVCVVVPSLHPQKAWHQFFLHFSDLRLPSEASLATLIAAKYGSGRVQHGLDSCMPIAQL